MVTGDPKEVQQILNHPSGSRIKDVIFGRFQRESGMTRKLLEEMVLKMQELQKIPVIGNVDCSHTTPMVTCPFGGKTAMKVREGEI